ncbi:Aste57867_23345 [Aphanomyces stellatus]|uniref:Aste57867_23345 protein n=1 Tax=Aphanomyces stellatus TaxID=120398 RepID=A0A485LMM5_9STRA|nr:hypothetical protein As57867_023274 [Aphanomyces stellatus]VFT99990.1 Aste57867_23345 [Aphanomyces stellatus]
MELHRALDVEAQWCILPPWVRAALLFRALHDPFLPASTRMHVVLAHYAHHLVHRHLSTHTDGGASRRGLPSSHPKYFSCLLEAPTPDDAPPPRRIVLLHGWLMSHKDWKQTAWKLHRVHGYSVLMVDFIGHGHSPYPPRYDALLPALYVHQVRDAIVRSKWASDSHPSSRKLTFAGISLGCAVSLRYAQLYPAHVYVSPLLASIIAHAPCSEKIIMLVGAGMPTDRWYAISPLCGRVHRAVLASLDALVAAAPSLLYWLNTLYYAKALVGHLHLVQFTPTHQVESGPALDKVLRRFASTAIWSHVDVLHPLQLELFDPPPRRVITVPFCEHGLFCKLIDFLALHADRELWDDPR